MRALPGCVSRLLVSWRTPRVVERIARLMKKEALARGRRNDLICTLAWSDIDGWIDVVLTEVGAVSERALDLAGRIERVKGRLPRGKAVMVKVTPPLVAQPAPDLSV